MRKARTKKKTIEHLKFITTHTIETERYLHDKDLSIVQYTCIGLLERLHSSALALSKLLPLINVNQNLDFSCGVILRSSILDYLIVLKMYIHLLDDEKNNIAFDAPDNSLLTFCYRCLGDGLPQTFSYVTTAEQVGIIDDEKRKAIFNNMGDSYKIFLEPHPGDGSVPKVKDKHRINARELFIEIAKHPEIREFAKIYDSYVGYSKYDHFSTLYFDVSRLTHEQKVNQMEKAVEHLIGSQSFLHMILRLHSADDKFLILQSDNAAKYLFENIIYNEEDKGLNPGEKQ